MTAMKEAASAAKSTKSATTQKPESYKEYNEKLLIYLTLSNIFISIQSKIPSIKKSKTYPGCVSSYAGYPLEENKSNIKGIEFIACVVLKLRQQKESIFNSIKKTDNVKSISTNMKGYINIILKLNSEARIK